MSYRLWTVAVLIIAVTPLRADPGVFLHFASRPGPSGASMEIYCNTGVVMRLRGQHTELARRANTVTRRLNSAVMSPTAASDIRARTDIPQPRVLIGDTVIVTADEQTARASGMSADALAKSWAKNLRRAIPESYTTLLPSGHLPVPVGETRSVRWGGTTAPGSVDVDEADVAAAFIDAENRRILVMAKKPGDTHLRVRMEEAEKALHLECKKWAARIPQSATLLASGQRLRERAAQRAVRNLVHFVSMPEPDARMNISDLLAAGSGYQVDVSASGPGYFPVKARQRIIRRPVAAPEQPAALLMVSNMPEKVSRPQVLLAEPLEAGRSARVLWHHVNASGQELRFCVRLVNPTQQAASVHLTGASAGPSDDEIFAGHAAAVRYMDDLFSSTGYVAHLPAATSTSVVEVSIPPGQLASGVMRIAPRIGGKLRVRMVAEPSDGPASPFAPVSEAHLSEKTTGFLFEGERRIALSHTVGDGQWSFFSLGRETGKNSRGVELMGNYGVLYRIDAVIDNPTGRPAEVEMTMRPRGGAARGTFRIDGKIVETPLLTWSTTEAVVHTIRIAPRSTLRLPFTTMPESGSHYPVLLTVRSSTR